MTERAERRLRPALVAMLVLALGGALSSCSSKPDPETHPKEPSVTERTSPPTTTTADGSGKVCGLWDARVIEKAGLSADRTVAQGSIADKRTRHDNTISCTLVDKDRHETFVLAIVAEKYAAERAATETQLKEESDRKGGTCTQPPALASLGTGYVCPILHGVSVNVLLPQRLVRLNYYPLDQSSDERAIEMAIELVKDLNTNIDEYDAG